MLGLNCLQIDYFFPVNLYLNLLLFVVIYRPLQIAVFLYKLLKTFLLLFDHFSDFFFILASALEVAQRLNGRVMVLLELLELLEELGFVLDFLLNLFSYVLL